MLDLTTVLAVVGAVLGAVSVVLHVVAPRTKNTVDDRLEAIVDAVIARLPK